MLGLFVSIFKYINSLVKCDKHNTLVITEKDSKLNEYANANSIKDRRMFLYCFGKYH